MAQPQQYWCHDCRNEMVPLMVPDPICPVCHGSFVEEITPASDPRYFQHDEGEGDDEFGGADGQGGPPPVMYRFGGPGGGGFVVGGGVPGAAVGGQPINPLSLLLQAFGIGPPAGHGAGVGRGGGAGGRVPVGGGQGQDADGQVPINNLAHFLGEAFGLPHPADNPENNPFAEGGVDEQPEHPEPGAEDGAAQPLSYLLRLLQGAVAGDGGAAGLFGAPQGNLGDFAWGEAGFQQILQDLMEQASGRAGPQPATDEIIASLPITKVSQDVLDLETIKDCPICRDDYEVGDELMALPCNHAFHPACLKQWLLTSGTCPVCRHSLVPQPGDPAGDPSSPSLAGPSNAPQSPSTERIPDMQGSRLPGSFPFPPSRGRNVGEGSEPEDLPIEDLD